MAPKQKSFRVWNLLPGDMLYVIDDERWETEPYVEFIAIVIAVQPFDSKGRWSGAGSYKYKKRHVMIQVLVDNYKKTTAIDGWEAAGHGTTIARGTRVMRNGVRIFPPRKSSQNSLRD